MITASGDRYITSHGSYPRVSRILWTARSKAFGGISPTALQAAAARGTAVHAALEYANRGCLDTGSLHPLIAPYVASYSAWQAILQPVTEATERMQVSERHKYGGRWDWLCRLAGKYKGLWIVDIKSGMENPADRLQTAAYWALYQENEKPKGTVLRAALYVHRDGSPARFVPHTDPTDLAVFLSYRTIYGWEEAAYGEGGHQ
jgi:hypothetical protein